MAHKNRRKRLPTVGRVLPIVSIRSRVYRELETIAHRLASVRALAWRLYGSRAALGRTHEQTRRQASRQRPLPQARRSTESEITWTFLDILGCFM